MRNYDFSNMALDGSIHFIWVASMESASGKPTLDFPLEIYPNYRPKLVMRNYDFSNMDLDGSIHFIWVASMESASGKPTSVGLDGPIHLYGLLQWIASGKPTSVGLDGLIHFIWVKNLILHLSHDVTSGSDITPCNKIDKLR